LDLPDARSELFAQEICRRQWEPVDQPSRCRTQHMVCAVSRADKLDLHPARQGDNLRRAFGRSVPQQPRRNSNGAHQQRQRQPNKFPPPGTAATARSFASRDDVFRLEGRIIARHIRSIVHAAILNPPASHFNVKTHVS